ncbi:MAG: hypothetical protein E6G54_06905 [Actinobacteria bacterium]|nr:MAG: hypothetical protein E6G54_06905 [Actinomycetota bacterium]
MIDRCRLVPAAALMFLVPVGLVACQGGAPAALPTTGTPSALPSLPRGLPTSYRSDLPAGDVPVGDLVPMGNVVTGTWYARTSAGDAIVVAWQRRGADPFRTERGIAVWLHGADPGSPWRPIDAVGFRANRDPVLGLTAVIGDVTGDASDDALVFAETGGSGGCGIYFAIDLAEGARVFDRSVCDTSIVPSTDPVGLVVTEAVYAHGDPHCCPSAMRRSVLTYAGGDRWTTSSRTTTPA